MAFIEKLIRVVIVVTCCNLATVVTHDNVNNHHDYNDDHHDYNYNTHDLDSNRPYPGQDINRFNNDGYYNGVHYGYGYGGGSLPDQRCGRSLRKADCPLFDFKSNLVSKYDYLNAISSESTWINIYTIEIGSPYTYGKCVTRFELPKADQEFLQREECFNLNTNVCEDLTGTIVLEEDDCGRIKVQGVNRSVDETFYSQDISQYLWRDICEERIDDENCGNGRFIDLNVKASRIVEIDEARFVDLASLPWELISADLKNIYGREFTDPEIRYVFGEECEI